MNKIQVLNNQEVLGNQFILYGDIEEPLFLAKDVADMIGHTDVSKMVKAVDEDEKLIGTLFVSGQNREVWFLTEDGLYEVLMQSRKPIAKQFKKEVKAILKQLRRSGVVITESATKEAIDYESKYGVRRIRKTFRETTNLIETWNEFKALSKIERDARRINNDVRIKGCGIIVDELQDYLANNVAEMKTYEVVMYQEIIQEILAEKNRLSNKYYGGLLSAQTKQIKKLEQQVEELTPDDLVFTTIDIHPFTTNCMYESSQTGKTHRSEAYNKWINKFPAHQVPTLEEYAEYEGIDFTKPIGIEIRYVCKDGFDIDNLNKATIDMIFNRIFRVDDNIVQEVKSTKIESCNTYGQGKIIFAIYNID
jgi:prophage antirepressor-like protein/Holliday junction resolvase RusA-like endonuclease